MNKKCLRPILLGAILTLVCAASPARAQTILHRFDGTQIGGTLGAVVANLGDFDGDGVPEIGASAPLASEKGYPAGPVIVYSGATGGELFRIGPADPRGMCLALASAGDVDGDGVPDILVGTPFSAPPIGSPAGLLYGAGRALVYSGRTREILFAFDGEDEGGQLGHSVDILHRAAGADAAGIIIGIPYATAMGRRGVGSAVVRSLSDGEVLFRFDGSNPGDYLGWAVAGVGDLDGDGSPDIVLTAPHASPNGVEGAGIVQLRSGKTGELIYQLNGQEAGANFGSSVAVAGDIDGDGVPDLIIGAPTSSPEGRSQAGSVFVYSGATGELIFRLDGPEPFDGFGASVAGGGDVDGDKVPDLIVGAPSASPSGRVGAGSVFVFSGATGELVFRFDGRATGDSLGASVAAGGSLRPGDTSAVIVGSPYASPEGRAGAGSVFVLVYP